MDMRSELDFYLTEQKDLKHGRLPVCVLPISVCVCVCVTKRWAMLFGSIKKIRKKYKK